MECGCSAIGRSLASGRAFGPSPTKSVIQAKYRSQNIATSIAEVTRTANLASGGSVSITGDPESLRGSLR